MKTVYTFVKSSSLINYDVNKHEQDYYGRLHNSRMIGMISPKNYKKAMEHGFNEKYLMRGEK